MADRTCAVEGCAHVGQTRRGWCQMHYQRWKRSGDPAVRTVLRGASVGERLAARSESRGDCLVWTGATNPSGYGKIVVEGRTLGVHRVAYEMRHGPIPDGMYVCHRCDNPPCFRDEHLFVGTPRENTKDSAVKQRRYVPSGERNPMSVLTPEDVRAIRDLSEQGVPNRQIAARFGVSPTNVGVIVRRLTWRDVA